MIDRCICQGVTLAELKAVAERDGLDFDGLKAATGCCTGCTLCEPYIRVMLKTGVTELRVMTRREASRVCAEGRGEVRRK